MFLLPESLLKRIPGLTAWEEGLRKMTECTDRHFMKGHEDKCECFLQQGSISDLGIGWGCQAGSCPVEKVLVGSKLGRRLPARPAVCPIALHGY